MQSFSLLWHSIAVPYFMFVEHRDIDSKMLNTSVPQSLMAKSAFSLSLLQLQGRFEVASDS